MADKTRKVIGVDLGGSKLLAGVVDEAMDVHMRVHRAVIGLSQGDVIDAVVQAIEEAREEVPTVEGVGLGIPALIDQRTGVAVIAPNLPIAELPIRQIMEERVDLP